MLISFLFCFCEALELIFYFIFVDMITKKDV